MRSPILGLALLVVLTGCQANGPLGASVPKAGAQQAGSAGASGTALRIGALQFKPASAEVTQRLAAGAMAGGQTTGATGAAAATDAAAPMAAPMAQGKVSASSAIAGGYGFGGYFGGPYGQMKLESVQEASAAGATGAWSEVVAKVLGPAVADWAPDARLLNASGALDENGDPAAGEESYPGELGWHASYASVSRGEVLQFTVTAKATQVVKLHWVPLQLDAGVVKVDAKAAVAKLTAAIKDAAAKSKEETLGHDPFFGTDGGPNVGIAVPMAAVYAVAQAAETKPADGQMTPVVATAPVIAPPPPTDVAPYQPPKEEPLYQLQAGGRWSANLQAIGDYLVWELHYNPSPANTGTAVNPGQPWTDPYAYGMVDARTGEVLRMHRPTRYTPAAGQGTVGATGGGASVRPGIAVGEPAPGTSPVVAPDSKL